MSDVTDRLARANPVQGEEALTPEEQGEAEALLTRLLATPPRPEADERRARPPRVPRRALLAAGLAGAAIVAVVAIDLLDSNTPRSGVIENAVAAVTRDDVVYHVLERVRVTPSPTGRGDQRFYLESWHTSAGRMHRKTFAASGGRRGRLLDEFAGRRRPGRRGGPALRYDPRQDSIMASGFGGGPGTDGVPGIDPFGDPGVQLRALREQGRLRLAGTTRVGEAPAYRLLSGPLPRADRPNWVERLEFLVDRDTYLPLARRHSVRFGSERMGRFLTRYLVYERLPLNASSRARLDLDPHPGATCTGFAGDLRGDRSVGFPNPCPPTGQDGASRAP